MKTPRFVDWWNRIKVRAKKRKSIAYSPTKPIPMPDDREIAQWHDKQWKNLDPAVRQEAAIVLRKLPEWQTVADFVRSEYETHGDGWIHAKHGHFGWGMAIRNYLRTGQIIEWKSTSYYVGQPPPRAEDHVVTFDSGYPGIKDDRLPTGNWDDYYTQALEFAAGIRAE
jgi:hypothetical protein